MEWRRPRDEWEANRGEGNRQAMRALIDAGTVPGILAYDGDEPVGWCSISPRAQHRGLEAVGSYRNFANPDVWLVSCFYISHAARGRGMMACLLDEATSYAKQHGAKVVEAYPGDDSVEGPGPGLYLGSVGTFSRAGFVEVARGVYNRPVMRYYVEAGR
jgi:GNAT superfamily N-acetyltransferase